MYKIGFASFSIQSCLSVATCSARSSQRYIVSHFLETLNIWERRLWIEYSIQMDQFSNSRIKEYVHCYINQASVYEIDRGVA